MVTLEEFLEMLAVSEFVVGDAFWLEGNGFKFHFEVISRKAIR
jgi:hypothetical protein